MTGFFKDVFGITHTIEYRIPKIMTQIIKNRDTLGSAISDESKICIQHFLQSYELLYQMVLCYYNNLKTTNVRYRQYYLILRTAYREFLGFLTTELESFITNLKTKCKAGEKQDVLLAIIAFFLQTNTILTSVKQLDIKERQKHILPTTANCRKNSKQSIFTCLNKTEDAGCALYQANIDRKGYREYILKQLSHLKSIIIQLTKSFDFECTSIRKLINQLKKLDVVLQQYAVSSLYQNIREYDVNDPQHQEYLRREWTDESSRKFNHQLKRIQTTKCNGQQHKLIVRLNIARSKQQVVKAIQDGANVNGVLSNGSMPLFAAFSKPKAKEIILALIQNGVDINATMASGWTALMEAAKRGDVDIVNILLEKGANINATDNVGSTAIKVAAKKGHMNIVNILSEKGGRY